MADTVTLQLKMLAFHSLNAKNAFHKFFFLENSENCGVTRTCDFTSTAESHILLYKDKKANYLLHGY